VHQTELVARACVVQVPCSSQGRAADSTAEVHAIPGCATQGDTFEELMKNVHEAVEGCLAPSVF
jgi:hypothetical protein